MNKNKGKTTRKTKETRKEVKEARKEKKKHMDKKEEFNENLGYECKDCYTTAVKLKPCSPGLPSPAISFLLSSEYTR